MAGRVLVVALAAAAVSAALRRELECLGGVVVVQGGLDADLASRPEDLSPREPMVHQILRLEKSREVELPAHFCPLRRERDYPTLKQLARGQKHARGGKRRHR